MAQCQDERTIAEGSSDPVKITHVTEREESQQQQQQQPSVPSFHTKPTNVGDDLNVQRRDEHEIHHAQKKSMLQLAKEKAKTLIGWPGNDRREEDDDQFEEEESHDHFSPEEKENSEGVKKEETADLNSKFNSRLPDGSAVSPGLDAFPTGNLINDPDVDKKQEEIKTGIRSTFPNANVVTADYEQGTAGDRAPLPVETVQGQQEVPTAPGQLYEGITSISQSTEATSTASPDDDVNSNSNSDIYMAHQVHDIGDTADSTASIPASHLVQAEFSQERKEARPENYEPEKIDYSEPFARAPRILEGMPVKPITEEPAVEIVPIQQAAEDRWFDAADMVAKAPAVLKDQNPSLSYNIGSEEFGLTEPISDKVEYVYDKLGVTEIDRLSEEFRDLRAQETAGHTVLSSEEAISDDVVAGVPIAKDQSPSVTHIGSEEFGLTEPISVEVEYAEVKVGGTEINTESDEFQDLKAQEAEGRTVTSEQANENASRRADLGAYTSVEGSKDTPAMDLGGTDLYANEKEKVKKDEEGPGHDESYMENRVNVASKSGNGSVDEGLYAPDRMAEEEDYNFNCEKGESYGEETYETGSTGKNEISSQLGYGEYQEPEKEAAEKRTERPSADDEGVYEESGESLTDTPSAADESLVWSNHVVEDETADGQTMEMYEDDGAEVRTVQG